ncbi:MAG TPA: acyltransferase family protein [Sphingobacteriaceae bacterium]
MTAKRSHYLDWVRVIAMGVVFLFHCGRFFDNEDWHVKNAGISEAASVMVFLTSRWIMPLFFFVSGASTYFALQHRSVRRFASDRLKRILVPLVLGILILSPPQVYLERLSHNQFSGSFMSFIPYYFEGWYAFGGNFAWMGLHLWYLLLLLIFSFIALPLIYTIRGLKGLSIPAKPLVLSGAVVLLALPGTFVDPDAIAGSRIWGGWSIIEHFMIFLMGYLMFSSVSFPLILQRLRWGTLAAAIVLLMLMLMPDAHVNGLPFEHPWYFAKMLLRSGACFSWIFAILGFAARYLNTPGQGLRYLNEAVLPFYILHQAVIVPVGFYVVQMPSSIATKYMIIATASVTVVVALYLLIRRFNLLRFLFGMSVQRAK